MKHFCIIKEIPKTDIFVQMIEFLIHKKTGKNKKQNQSVSLRNNSGNKNS